MKNLKDKITDDLINFGMAMTKTDGIGIKYIDPMSDEAACAMYNSEHTDSQIHIKRMTLDEIKRKYPLTEKECFKLDTAKRKQQNLKR